MTQRAAGANFSVDVSAGTAIVTGDDQSEQGNYLCRRTSSVNVAVGAAPGSNSRYDIVILRINDTNAGGPAGDNFTVAVVAGTASATPTVPATPTSAILLATIGPIATATASITTSLIADTRTQAGRRARPGTLELSAYGVPSGWLLCNGAAVSRTTYAALFALFGTLYGAGNGTTTFNLPDLRDRVPIQAGTTFPTVGATGGVDTHTLTTAQMPAHSHGGNTGVQSANHTHNIDLESAGAPGPGGGVAYVHPGSMSASNDDLTTSGVSQDHTHAIPSEGSGTPFTNWPPHQVVGGWLIRT